MTTQTQADDGRIEYVTDEMQKAIDAHNANANACDVIQLGSGDDSYLAAKIVFESDATVQNVCKVQRTLPISFDTEIQTSGTTLAVDITVATP